jgi:uncharacterized membrane protein YccF (DUF307 family)
MHSGMRSTTPPEAPLRRSRSLIIGIPLGLASFKLITVGLRPFGREIVSVEEARRRGVPAATSSC